MLVTGAAGFIGSNFVRYWRDTHPADRIVAFDALTYAGVRANLDGLPGVRFVHGDICDRPTVEGVLREHAVDVVVNFAAESHNSLAVVNPSRFVRTNVHGTQVLCEAAHMFKVERFHHISTCEVYGDLALDVDDSFTELQCYAPRTPYNATKAGADHIVRAYFHTFRLPVTITNSCNNYGPRQHPEKLVPLFTTNALDGRPLPVYASAENRREWIHVLDHCIAIDRVLRSGRIGHTYNVGTGEERSVTQVADAILAALGKPASLKMTVPDRPGHDRRYLLNSVKIRSELGWEPVIPFDVGLPATVRWYETNRDWWEPLKAAAPIDEAGWQR